MSGINIKAICLILLGIIAGVFVMVEVITARASIGQLYLFAAIAAFIIGIFAPRPAMYILACCTVYIDVFKRLMVIGGQPTFLEVAYVQAVPPLLVAGSLISVFLSLAFSRNNITRDVVVSFLVSSLIACAGAIGVLTAISDREGLGNVGVMVNQGFYAFLVFTVPLLFPSDEERRKILHFTFIIMIPSVFYMFWQAHYGYADYEYDYLMTGLTIEAKNLLESMAGELRSFSTFNGSGTASTIYSIFLLFCFVPFRTNNQTPTFFQRWGKVMLAPLFAMAAYFTISRTGWFCGLGTLLAYFFLGTKWRSYFGIGMALALFVTVVALAPMAIKNNWLSRLETQLNYMAGKLTGNATVKRALVLGTFGDRLHGWSNLTQESIIWQPFGFTASGLDPVKAKNNDFRWGHDALIDILIKYGYVPLFVGLASGAFLMSRLFRYMYGLSRDSITFKITRLCLAFNAGIFVGAMSSGAQFRNFPQNCFMALWIAIPFATYQQAMRERKNALNAVVPSLSPPVTLPTMGAAAKLGMSAQR